MNHASVLPRPKVPVTAKGFRTRERLLRAAESVFAERGFEQSSIAEIASRAEAALGTFYVYFPDKKSVFIELVDELGQRLRHQLSEATAGLEDRLAVERAGFFTFFDFITEHRGLYRIVRQAEFVDEPTFRRYYHQFARGYVAGLEQAMDAGEVRRLDAEAIAYCLMGMADFLGMRWVMWQSDGDDVQRVLESAVSFMHHGLSPLLTPQTRPAASGANDRAPASAGALQGESAGGAAPSRARKAKARAEAAPKAARKPARAKDVR